MEYIEVAVAAINPNELSSQSHISKFNQSLRFFPTDLLFISWALKGAFLILMDIYQSSVQFDILINH